MPRFRAFGYNRVTLDGKVTEESDTLQCCHCNHTMFINPLKPTHWCSLCDWEHCSKPECFDCTPFMKKLEREEAIDRQKRLLWQAADNT